MSTKRNITRDEIDLLFNKIDNVKKRLDKIESDRSPTMPIYDSDNFPDQGTPGQVAIDLKGSGWGRGLDGIWRPFNAPIHFCYTRHSTQTITSGDSFTQVEISQLYSSDTTCFEPGDSGTYPNTILCKKKGLYLVDISVNEIRNLTHENRGYPRDVAPYFPGNQPVAIAPKQEVDSLSNDFVPEAGDFSFEGYISGTNSSVDPSDPTGITLREMQTRNHYWFSMNTADPTDMALGVKYRQVTGFDQTITANSRIAIFHFYSDADVLEFSDLAHWDY